MYTKSLCNVLIYAQTINKITKICFKKNGLKIEKKMKNNKSTTFEVSVI